MLIDFWLDLLFSEVVFILSPYKETKVFCKDKLHLKTLVLRCIVQCMYNFTAYLYFVVITK